MDYEKLKQVLKEAVDETMQQLGIDAFRKTSWFPSSRK